MFCWAAAKPWISTSPGTLLTLPATPDELTGAPVRKPPPRRRVLAFAAFAIFEMCPGIPSAIISCFEKRFKDFAVPHTYLKSGLWAKAFVVFLMQGH